MDDPVLGLDGSDDLAGELRGRDSQSHSRTHEDEDKSCCDPVHACCFAADGVDAGNDTTADLTDRYAAKFSNAVQRRECPRQNAEKHLALTLLL